MLKRPRPQNRIPGGVKDVSVNRDSIVQIPIRCSDYDTIHLSFVALVRVKFAKFTAIKPRAETSETEFGPWLFHSIRHSAVKTLLVVFFSALSIVRSMSQQRTNNNLVRGD